MMAGPPNGARKAAIGAALAAAVALPLLYPLVVVPLTPWQQAEVALALIGLGLLASVRPGMRPLIMLLSGFASMRYFYWRVTSTLLLDNPRDALVSLLLLGAETYGLLILLLGYFQTVEVHPRAPAAVVAEPTVDVFIPTYNEPLDVLRRTVIGALALDYPRKRVYVLDDGRRPEVAELARRLDCRYVTRPDNRHAKAGNLNHALARTDGELIAIFDADHVPVRGFLRQTVGFFEDARVALVQTAQHFFNPDPFERNLKLSGRIAPEQAFFYHVIQPGNDFWNAAFFCGSSAVLRRAAVESIGGFKTETVTEDAHTALELHARGWRSVYLPRALAAGLATETLAAHVQQRMRWARGMAQVLRLDCPLFKRGLTPSQRLNYFNATLHFFFGVPRLILLLAPLCYLLLGIHPIHADALALLAYILPHLALSTLANSMLSDRFRHSFWAGVYEVSIAPYTAWVTLLAVCNPRLGRFNVTDKGTQVDRSRLDFAHGWSVLALLALSVLALSVGFPLRLAFFERGAWEPSELNSILINSAWALANTWMLLAAACVAYEQPQQRRAPRLRRAFPCEVRLGEERLAGRTVDVSESGVRVRFARPVALAGECGLEIVEDAASALPLRAQPRWCAPVGAGEMEAAFQFVDVDENAHRRLVLLLFGRDESWRGQLYPRDDPFRSFAYLVSTPWRVTRPRRPRSLAVMLGLSVTALGCGSGAGEAPGPVPPSLLQESWNAYAARFIQADGRVIDFQGGQVTTSEGQAYALLRAAWMRDRPVFDRVLGWARANLNSGVRDDRLWAWRWGPASDGSWRVLDGAFASDGDEDAALALLVAWRTWDDPQYLVQARLTLSDLWERGTTVVQGRRFLLAGDSLCQGRTCRINPSYYAPYAYRVFARQDPGHDWGALVDTSYWLLDTNSRMTATGLPSNWLRLDTASGALQAGNEDDAAYSYDAFRAHWRVALDAALYGDPRARGFLDRSLAGIVERWKREPHLPAVIGADGGARADYEAPEMLAALMAALGPSAPDVADAMQRRVQSTYAGGIWGDRDAYYLQNWAWFGSALYGRQLAPFELVR